jgi:signal transduction histidine kinase
MGKSKAGRDRREPTEAGSKLASLLRQHQEEIAAAWAEMITALPGPFPGGLAAGEVRSLTSRGLATIAESLDTGSHPALEQYVADICCLDDDQAGPEVAAVTEALLLCKDAVLPIIRDECGLDSGTAWTLASALDERLRWMVRHAASACSAEMSRQLTGERARVHRLLDMAQTAGSTLELHEVVSRVAEGIAAALGADGCTFHLVNEEQRSTVFLRRPSDWSSRVLRSFDSYASAFHEVLRTRQPVTSYDAESDPRFVPERMREVGYKSMLGVPLVVKGKVIAEAWAYTLNDHRHFTEGEVALAQGIANVLALVIQSAELYEKSKLLTVMEERARLAREMHDGLAQTLAALQLKASQLEGSLSEERVAEAKGHLSQLEEMISRAYRDLREDMFGLRPVVEPGTALVAALREYLVQYRAQYGLEVFLEVQEDEPFVLDGEAQAQAMRIVHEALSNVRRHAGTDRVCLSIAREDDRLRICVMDEGQGFDVGLLEDQEDGLQLGLHGMRERAESVGGSLIVESELGHGTRVILQLPLHEERESA